ncbi:hypothetical protein AT575_06120 [Streptococcus penaeicida]|uniref:HTH LytTR-type domain-containing protein n=1 Tax=Streptococcus penaeicida TaxID=1765960 RepID=A0A2N8LBD5_9STRE|nr:LytTR family DNA-binding domain-containing protein [Streptococcus penaeicida]PND47477.1 hypothetical protein AT575_06120 [Streptococcus penaeicida]
MKIYILDEDIYQQWKLVNIVQQICEQNNWHLLDIETFSNSNKLLRTVTQRGGHQLFFLEMSIEGEQYKGIEVAKSIRLMDPYAHIIFVTFQTNCFSLLFQNQLSVLDYISKKMSKTDFLIRIELALKQINRIVSFNGSNDDFIFFGSKMRIQVPYSTILFIETSPKSHWLILHTIYDKLEFKGTLTQVIKQNQRLLKCHRSFLVNPENIIKIDLKDRILYFRTGLVCYISKSKIHKLVKFMKYN